MTHVIFPILFAVLHDTFKLYEFLEEAMKYAWRIVFVLTVFCLNGCATNGGKNYGALAREKDFSQLFPSNSGFHSFDTAEEAYDYVFTAREKFWRSSGKTSTEGRNGKLVGPPLNISGREGHTQVLVNYTILASNGNKAIDLSAPTGSLETAIRDAVSSTLYLWVFSEGRAVVIPTAYLQGGYIYDRYSQPENITFGNNTYKIEYSPGWSIGNAFRYLRKEID